MHVFIGKVELGQGILTALQLLVAEELDVPLQAVRIHSASTARGPDEGMTSGSLSVQDSGGALRQACAEARAMALQRAAKLLSGEPAEAIAVRAGRFCTAQGVTWATTRPCSAASIWTSSAPARAHPKTRVGAAPARPGPAAAHGPGRQGLRRAPRFIHDLRLPGMLHGRVLRPPTLDATLARWPAEAVAALPAGVRCWADGRFIAIVAPSEREADAAASRLAGLHRLA